MTAPWWLLALLFLVLALGAFAVPIVAPLRDSSARLFIAAVILLIGAGLSFALTPVGSRTLARATQPRKNSDPPQDR